ncbi:PAS domain S-box protein [Streptomyces sp. NPDC057062]|uniref:PAS domain S-box protein n=1 Tax=Streptomyces sp. NPDC057062 TaxID=3346011 RepID=UPI00362E107F
MDVPQGPVPIRNAEVIVDERGMVLSWGIHAEQLLGYSASEVLGRSITDVMPVELPNTPAVDRDLAGRGRCGDGCGHR